MSSPLRYAIYALPSDEALADFGAEWLGWDIEAGAARPQTAEIAQMTNAPRRYGFHGTMKPPFRLAPAYTEDDLLAALSNLARRAAAVHLAGLKLARLGSFLALVPVGSVAPIAELADRCVRDLDQFRAPADAAELARRRSAGLSKRQDGMLQRWGYPYVGEEFRFHMTLTGSLAESEMEQASRILVDRLPALPQPFEVNSLALVGEYPDGMFRRLHHCALIG